jgi:hypothetical protein
LRKTGLSTMTAAICTTRSLIVGIPSGLRLPLGFGMYTRRTASGLTGTALRSSLRTNIGLPRRNVRSAQHHLLSRPAQRSLSLGPARSLIPQGNLFHRRLQPLHCFHDCSNCYRPERQWPGGFRTHWAMWPFHGAHYEQDYDYDAGMNLVAAMRR